MSDATVSLRPARSDDHEFVARLFLEMRTGDDPPSEKRWADYKLEEWTIAEVDGEPAGYMWFQVMATEGHVRQIVVDPTFQRRGIARKLMMQGAERTRSAGLDQWSLNVIAKNTPAVMLYKNLGMSYRYDSVTYRFVWSLLEQIPFPEMVLDTVPVKPEEFEEIERIFDLTPGILAERATVPSVVVKRLLNLQDPTDLTMAVAAFDRDFPGCYPFRARDPRHALAMLRGLRVDGWKPMMGVVVENDPALDAFFAQIGARVQLRFVHYSGPLPSA